MTDAPEPPKVTPDSITIFAVPGSGMMYQAAQRVYAVGTVEPPAKGAKKKRIPKKGALGSISADASAYVVPVESIEPKAVKAKEFQRNLEDTINVLRASFAGSLEHNVGGLRVEEIEVALEVGAEGKVGIFGTGASLSGKSSITVRFKRQ